MTGRSSTGFVASGNHLVLHGRVRGRLRQLREPGRGLQHFNDFSIISTEAVTISTDAYITGDVQVYGTMVVPAAATVSIEGAITLFSGSTFDVDGTVDARGGCTDLGAYITGTGTQNCGTAVNADRVWVGGDANGPQDWQNLNNWDPLSVPGSGESVFIPYEAANSPSCRRTPLVGSLRVGASGHDRPGGLQPDGVVRPRGRRGRSQGAARSSTTCRRCSTATSRTSRSTLPARFQRRRHTCRVAWTLAPIWTSAPAPPT